MPHESRRSESERSRPAHSEHTRVERKRTLSKRPERPVSIRGEKKVGDLYYPPCTIIPLDWKRTFYPEEIILDFLSKLDYGSWIEEIHDCEDQSLQGMASIRNSIKFYGAAVGMAIGSIEPDGPEHAVIIYWIDEKTRKYWDPGIKINVYFHPKIVVA